MGTELRVYLEGEQAFFGRRTSPNYGPGYPGTTHVEFCIEQFIENSVFKKGILDKISEHQRVAGASMCLVKMGYGYKPKHAIETDGVVTITSDGTLSYVWAKDPRHVLGAYLKLMDMQIVGTLPVKCESYREFSWKIPQERVTFWRVMIDTCNVLTEKVKAIFEEMAKRAEKDFSTK